MQIQIQNCFCVHNIIVQMIPVYDGPGNEWIFMDFCFTLNSLEAFTIIQVSASPTETAIEWH